MKITESMILFWQESDIYSNFHPAPFTLDGYLFHCSEQSFMYRKALHFNDRSTADAILRDPLPLNCKRLGRSVRNFDSQNWSQVSAHHMFHSCFAKFQQNPPLRNELLASGERLLVEASPYDRIWGIGLGEDHPDALDQSRWQGENRLGKVLMAVREALRGEG